MIGSNKHLVFLLAGVVALAALAPCATARASQRPQGGPGQGPPRGDRPQGPPRGDGPPRDHRRPPPPPPPRRDGPPEGRPGDPRFNFLSAQMRFDGPPKTGAPFSADVTTESTQMLADGTSITRKDEGRIARDSQGRSRRELSVNAIGPFAPAGDPVPLIFISDPVAGLHYVLDPETRTGREVKLSTLPPPLAEPPEYADSQIESLGKQTIEGVEVEGTRSTIVIPEGQIGNSRPLTIITERWYSPALETTILSSHSDPRLGKTVYRLTNIRRVEPDRSLFFPSRDFTIEKGDDRPPRRRDKKGGDHHGDRPRPE